MLFLNEQLILRTQESYDEDALEGTSDITSNGVKGSTLLGENIKFPDKILIDYMHLIFEGVCKILCHKWFNSKNKDQEFYIGILSHSIPYLFFNFIIFIKIFFLIHSNTQI